MASIAEKPGVMELVGVATISPNLASTEDRERAVDRIAALGVSCMAMAAQRPRFSIERHQIEVQLAPMIWRLWAGRDLALEPYVSASFAEWMRHKGGLPKLPGGGGDISAGLAARVVYESTHCICPRCNGSGRLEFSAKGLITPQGRGVRNVRYTHCRLCGGSGRALMIPALRAAAIGVPVGLFKERRLDRHFEVSHCWLLAIAERLREPLQFKLGRRRIAPK